MSGASATSLQNKALSWAELRQVVRREGPKVEDLENGPTNAQARLRLFGQPKSAVRVTLYRDNHAWCPYCQKVWLFLEEKRIPYEVEKVTMFCYGDKELWYRRIVPSGMLPALAIDGEVTTESDDILVALESEFGPLGLSLEDREATPYRRLERTLFSAWCQWLCYPSDVEREERVRAQFEHVVEKVEEVLGQHGGPFFLGDEISVIDLVFAPYVERMNASLFYYKGYSLRDSGTAFGEWFDAMESRETYRGTQSNFHTHVHDLPPQMGQCFENGSDMARRNQILVNEGPFDQVPEIKYPEPEGAALEALSRVVKHHEAIIGCNPSGPDITDEGLRCVLTKLATGNISSPPKGSDSALRYICDRISSPRDMSPWAARILRTELEATAALAGPNPGPPIPTEHRLDQNPLKFNSELEEET